LLHLSMRRLYQNDLSCGYLIFIRSIFKRKPFDDPRKSQLGPSTIGPRPTRSKWRVNDPLPVTRCNSDAPFFCRCEKGLFVVGPVKPSRVPCLDFEFVRLSRESRQRDTLSKPDT